MSCKPCPPPHYGLLSAAQKEIIERLVTQMLQVDFNYTLLKADEQEMQTQMAQACQSELDWSRLFDYLELVSKWHRLPAFWLTYLCQLVTQKTNSPHHIYACVLYSDAQVNLNSDLALNSLEIAYNNLISNKERLKEESFLKSKKYIYTKLHTYHKFYLRFCKPFKYTDCNPIDNHLYSLKTQSELLNNFPEQIKSFVAPEPEHLHAVIDQCEDEDCVYYRILARRYLGITYQERNKLDAACEQFQLGIIEAEKYGLETEIGHFYRLYGYALKTMGRFHDAEQQFIRAYNFEASPYLSFWQALSARELGDIRWQIAISPKSIASNKGINARPALEAYNLGRSYFEAHLGSLVVPLDRAIKKQMFRSFTDNALIAASYLQNLKILLAEIEANSPHSATEIMAEVMAAVDLPDETQKDFLQAREIFHRHLNSVPEKFDDYLDALPQEYQSHQGTCCFNKQSYPFKTIK